jgi:hypothetical protein
VFIAEDLDDGPEIGYLSGLFSAHWESDSEPFEFEEGPEGVGAEEAITWGRSRADVVLIRVGEGGYVSAGSQQPADEILPEWPVAGMQVARRRSPSHWYLDRAPSDPAIDWQVRIDLYVYVDAEPAAVEDRATRVVGALSQDPEVTDLVSSRDEDVGPVQIGIAGHNPSLSIRFRLRASTYDDANQRALAIGERALSTEGATSSVGRPIQSVGISLIVEPSSHTPPSQ